jgi:hypothetical protein
LNGGIDEGEPIGPSAAEEAALLRDDRGAEIVSPPPPAERPTADGSNPLPSLESLIDRIPPPLRAALDEHVRARFVRVRRLRRGELR